jgi:hypothetical protein
VASVRAALIVLAGVVVVALSGCGGSGEAQPAQATQRPLKDLVTVDALKDDFNADAGRTRLLLILSPT